MLADIAFEEINIGDRASFSKTVSETDVLAFAGITGDYNPIHVDEGFAGKSRFKRRVVHGMLSAALISTVLGTVLPGANTVYLSQEIKFLSPAYLGDTLRAEVEVLDKREDKRIITFKTTVTNQEGKVVADGRAVVMKELVLTGC